MNKIYLAIDSEWKGQAIPKAFPWHVRIGLKASFLIPQLFAIKMYGLPFGLISKEKRVNVIQRINDHANPSIRNIVQLWKLVASMTKC